MFLDKTVTEHTLQIKNRKNRMETQNHQLLILIQLKDPLIVCRTYPFIKVEVATMKYFWSF